VSTNRVDAINKTYHVCTIGDYSLINAVYVRRLLFYVKSFASLNLAFQLNLWSNFLPGLNAYKTPPPISLSLDCL
jgi:hypothetical protein